MTILTIVNIVFALISVAAAVVVIAGRNVTGELLELIVKESNKIQKTVAAADEIHIKLRLSILDAKRRVKK